jgi:hypothetical protein
MTRTIVVLAMAGVAACTTVERIGPPRLPQLEQAQEVMTNPGDRLNAHRACTGTSKTIDDMVDCMSQSGYVYLARSPEYDSAECWRLRDDPKYGGGRMPEAFCFRKAKATPKP